MKGSIQYNRCPFCGSEQIQRILLVRDHTVTGEEFPIFHCRQCSGRFTQDVPGAHEISRYYQSEEYVSHSETREGIIHNLYHRIRKRTLNQKLHLVQKYTKRQTGQVLDLGCGTGAFLNRMKEGGWEVRGLEPDPGAREKARELYGLNIEAPETLSRLPPSGFQAITLWHVLEHVHSLHDYLDRIKELISKDGAIFIAVPNYTSFDAQHYQQYWAAYDVPRHLYHFSPACMMGILNSHGLKLKTILPMWYDSFYVSMLSEKYRSGKQHLSRAFTVGLLSNMKALRHTEHCSSVIYVVYS